MDNRAVLTGDIVNSTKLSPAAERRLTRLLGELLTGYLSEFFRGDSFQVYVKKPEQALQLALLCRTAAISLLKEDSPFLPDIRISIGIGTVDPPVRSLKNAKGEAFLLSGRHFDAIGKSHQRLVIAAGNPLANEGLQVIADYLNAIFESMTAKQAEVIFRLLKGLTRQEVAAQLKKTKSTIHQLLTSGHWEEIERLLQQFKNIIHHLQ
jgi:hypothetical protein